MMKLISLYLPVTYIKLVDELVDEGFYPNMSEAIRLSARTLLSEHGKFEVKTNYKPPKKRELAAVERLLEHRSRRSPILTFRLEKLQEKIQ